MRVTVAAKPELSLHMLSRLIWCFTQHVRDCFHFTAIAKGLVSSSEESGLPKMTCGVHWHARCSDVS